MRLLLLSILALATVIGPPRNLEGQAPARDQELFLDLQNEKTSDAAAAQLLQHAKENAETRDYLTSHLPVLIRNPKGGSIWLNSVRLAGELKIQEAAPVLADLLTKDTVTGGFIDFHRVITLENDPPGRALALIGDPAIPAVAKILETGDRDARFRAVYVLRNIGSPKAKDALRQHLSAEKDPAIRSLIGVELK